MAASIEDFEERMKEYGIVDVDSINMETINACINGSSEGLKGLGKVKRKFLFIVISESIFLLVLTALAAYYFRNARYLALGFQVFLMFWNLVVLNKSANSYSKSKKEIADLKEFIVLMTFIKDAKVEQAASKEQA